MDPKDINSAFSRFVRPSPAKVDPAPSTAPETASSDSSRETAALKVTDPDVCPYCTRDGIVSATEIYSCFGTDCHVCFKHNHAAPVRNSAVDQL